MPPKTGSMPPVIAAIFGIFWFFMMGGMTVAYVIMLRICWRVMKAHEKIANKLGEVADKMQAK